MIHHGQSLAFRFETAEHTSRVHAGFDQLEGDSPLDRFLLISDPNLAHTSFADPFQQVAGQPLQRFRVADCGAGHPPTQLLHCEGYVGAIARQEVGSRDLRPVLVGVLRAEGLVLLLQLLGCQFPAGLVELAGVLSEACSRYEQLSMPLVGFPLIALGRAAHDPGEDPLPVSCSPEPALDFAFEAGQDASLELVEGFLPAYREEVIAVYY